MILSEAIHPPTLLRLMRGVDGLPPGATGALSFTSIDAARGTVLVENRRICWAAAPEMENRLTDLLRWRAGGTPPVEAFEEVFDDCRLRRKPLGETLVRRGLVTKEGLRSALLDHAAEAIARLSAATHLVVGWVPNPTKCYDAQFTFSTSEILCAVGALGAEEAAWEAGRKLVEVTPEGSVGVAYLAETPEPLPIAQVSAEDWASQSLVDLGHWARHALENRPPGEVSGSVLGSDTVHSLKRAWRSGDLVLVRFTGDEEPEPLVPPEPFDLEHENVLTR